MAKKVLLAMSGGIDSTVAAILLKDQEFIVEGITFQLWKKNKLFPKVDFNEVREIASKLKINHHVIDLSTQFKEIVINYFRDEYFKGQTPFPCVLCNKEIKWNTLLNYSKEHKFDYISSGHYVRKLKRGGIFYLKEGKDKDKDQSFFMWNLNQKILSKAIFPLGDYVKKNVRRIAAENEFNYLIHKKESTGPCFLGNENYRPFLRKLFKEQGLKIPNGEFIDRKGNFLGKHMGYPFYTIGQRRQLGIYLNKALFVKEIDKEQNRIMISSKKELYKNDFYIRNYNFFNIKELDTKKTYIVKIRYRKQVNACKIKILDAYSAYIKLLEPLDSIAPGQTAVFYNDDILIGGGFIQK